MASLRLLRKKEGEEDSWQSDNNFKRSNRFSNSLSFDANFCTFSLPSAKPGARLTFDAPVFSVQDSVPLVPDLASASTPALAPTNDPVWQFMQAYIEDYCKLAPTSFPAEA